MPIQQFIPVEFGESSHVFPTVKVVSQDICLQRVNSFDEVTGRLDISVANADFT